MFGNTSNLFGNGKSSSVDIEGVILDAELLIKYRFVERAITTLEKAIGAYPKNIDLRTTLLEVCADYNFPTKAAEQAVALSKLYAESGDLEKANECLIRAKGFDPNLAINIPMHQEFPKLPMSYAIPISYSVPMPAPALRATLRLQSKVAPSVVEKDKPVKVLTGDLATVTIFDVIQMVENSRITGILEIFSASANGKIYFNYGQIADAQVDELRSNAAFKCFVELNEGRFELEKSPVEFKQNITAPNNTNLILDILREVDEEKRDKMMGG